MQISLYFHKVHKIERHLSELNKQIVVKHNKPAQKLDMFILLGFPYHEAKISFILGTATIPFTLGESFQHLSVTVVQFLRRGNEFNVCQQDHPELHYDVESLARIHGGSEAGHLIHDKD
uniref:Uncharacterized protein n=1 Tax=Cacopsylla melanoneura TaxID=428564 RepID=A0A8D9BGZ3_9HEMI